MSETALAERPAASVEEITRKHILDYLDAFGLTSQLEGREKEQFIAVAVAFQLNPLKREIYCIPYGEGDRRRLSIVTGYETYLKRASRLGLLKGWRAWTEGDIKPVTIMKHIEFKDKKTGALRAFDKEVQEWKGQLVAKVEIYRADWDKPFLHEVDFEEYRQDNEMWRSKPRTMLKKVAIAQAFRLCFPEDYGGMPYTSDELPDKMTRAVEPEATYVQTADAVPHAPIEQEHAPPDEAPELEELRTLARELELSEDTKKRLWSFYQHDLPSLVQKLRAELAARDAEAPAEDPVQATPATDDAIPWEKVAAP